MLPTNKHNPLPSCFLGCIADDFTGATDLASFLVASGMRTIQINDIPTDLQLNQLISQLSDCDAIVIALKTRSIPKNEAVELSLRALEILQRFHCQKIFYKYCSTFDSTAEGNIGPVIDSLLSALGETSTIICPALPVNGRTIYQGHLFVFDKLLHESSMRHHPVTPMLDSSLIRLIEAQGKGKATNIAFQVVNQGAVAITQAMEEARKSFNYLVVDALTEDHLIQLGKACSSFKLITGGSGLATDLCSEFEAKGFVRHAAKDSVPAIAAPCLVVSGSCSAMTQQQVAYYQNLGRATLKVDPIQLHQGTQTLAQIMEWIAEQLPKNSPLVYATADAESVKQVHAELGAEASQQLLENTLAEVAFQSLALGVRNFVVAGGETSGAIVKRLGLNAFKIGPSITPGVPVVQSTVFITPSGTLEVERNAAGTQTSESNYINLALKSGNFGQPDFFSKAVETLLPV